MSSYTVVSPIKVGGQIRAIGAIVELDAQVAAALPAGRVEIVGDAIDALLGRPTQEILDAAATMSATEIEALGGREHAKGAAVREELLGWLMKAFAARKAKDDKAEAERADAQTRLDAEEKAKSGAESKGSGKSGKK